MLGVSCPACVVLAEHTERKRQREQTARRVDSDKVWFSKVIRGTGPRVKYLPDFGAFKSLFKVKITKGSHCFLRVTQTAMTAEAGKDTAPQIGKVLNAHCWSGVVLLHRE